MAPRCADLIWVDPLHVPAAIVPSNLCNNGFKMSDAIHSLLNNLHPRVRLPPFGNFPLDENVVAHFPEGTKVLTADNYGSSAWTVTARINVELADGTPKRYFFKCATEDAGRVMMEGEFEAMTELHRTMPSLVPPP